MPKAREQFAEFLDQDSLDRFGILYLTTSVGLGTGGNAPDAEAFLGTTDHRIRAVRPPSSRLAPTPRGFACGTGSNA